jgi:hypothetical protein
MSDEIAACCPHGDPATLCAQCHERSVAVMQVGRHRVTSRFCSEACALAYPAVPDDIDVLREQLIGGTSDAA